MSKVLGAWGGVQCSWGDGELGGEEKERLVRSEGLMVKGLICHDYNDGQQHLQTQP